MEYYTPPAGYTPEADRELDSLYRAITGRPTFSYRPSADPLYQSLRDRTVQDGRMAMRDTMGQAAALTGGYGSSYAQSVGQQQYDEYLRSLSEALPELYGLAFQRYTAEGDALQNAYDLGFQRREADYRRQRDALADQQAARQQSYKQQQDSYQKLVKLISSTGYSPNDGELQAAGLSRAQAEALRQEYLRLNGLLPQARPAAGGGGGGGSGQSGKSKNAARKVGKAVSNGVTGKSASAAAAAAAAAPYTASILTAASGKGSR